jgi:hypothetical protein
VSGLNSGGHCISTIGPNIALAIGTGASATAVNGLFGTAIAIGNGAEATQTGGVFGTALALSSSAVAETTGGLAGTAIALGGGSNASTGPASPDNPRDDVLPIAIAVHGLQINRRGQPRHFRRDRH